MLSPVIYGKINLMEVVVNGQIKQVVEGISVQELLDQFQIKPIRVAVERNREIVTRKQFSATRLTAGDQIEIVTFVGGG